MLLTMTNDLSPRQIEDIRALHSRCAAHDGTTAPLLLDADMNLDPNLPAYYLGTEDGELISFLSIFAPDAAEAEIVACIAPQYRRRGYFRALLQAVQEQLSQRGVQRMLLHCDAASTQGQAAMAALGAQLSFSEYSMTRPLADLPPADNRLMIAEAGAEELESLVQLAVEVFGDDPVSCRTRLSKAMETPTMSVYSARLDGQPVGLCRIIWDETPPGICTLGVHPSQRGHGLGEALLVLMLRQIAERGYKAATLDVDSGNIPALTLYRKVGFQVLSQIDYYELRV